MNSRRVTDWSERYRPNIIAECVLPRRIRTIFDQMLSEKRIENAIFFGPYGCGKSSSASALCNELQVDSLPESGFEKEQSGMIARISGFATTASLTGKARKVVVLDDAEGIEADYQDRLRSLIERVSGNCSFLLTTNAPARVSRAIQSRCLPVNFNFTVEDIGPMKRDFAIRLARILAEEDVEFSPKEIVTIIDESFPDFRACLKRVQFAVRPKVQPGTSHETPEHRSAKRKRHNSNPH